MGLGIRAGLGRMWRGMRRIAARNWQYGPFVITHHVRPRSHRVVRFDAFADTDVVQKTDNLGLASYPDVEAVTVQDEEHIPVLRGSNTYRYNTSAQLGAPIGRRVLAAVRDWLFYGGK